MARVPELRGPSVAPAALPNAFQTSNATVASFGGEQAAGMISAGQQISQAGDTLGNLAIQIQIDDNERELKGLETQWRNEVFRLGYSNDGFYSLRGQTAVDGYNIYGEGLEEFRTQLIDSSTNSAVMEDFSDFSAESLNSEYIRASDHTVSQRIKANDDVSAAREASAINMAAADPLVQTDPALGVIHNESVGYMARHGLEGDEVLDQIKRDKADVLVDSIVSTAVANNQMDLAMNLLTSYGPEMNAAGRAELSTKILSVVNESQAQEVVAQLLQENNNDFEAVRGLIQRQMDGSLETAALKVLKNSMAFHTALEQAARAATNFDQAQDDRAIQLSADATTLELIGKGVTREQAIAANDFANANPENIALHKATAAAIKKAYDLLDERELVDFEDVTSAAVQAMVDEGVLEQDILAAAVASAQTAAQRASAVAIVEDLTGATVSSEERDQIVAAEDIVQELLVNEELSEISDVDLNELMDLAGGNATVAFMAYTQLEDIQAAIETQRTVKVEEALRGVYAVIESEGDDTKTVLQWKAGNLDAAALLEEEGLMADVMAYEQLRMKQATHQFPYETSEKGYDLAIMTPQQILEKGPHIVLLEAKSEMTETHWNNFEAGVMEAMAATPGVAGTIQTGLSILKIQLDAIGYVTKAGSDGKETRGRITLEFLSQLNALQSSQPETPVTREQQMDLANKVTAQDIISDDWISSDIDNFIKGDDLYRIRAVDYSWYSEELDAKIDIPTSTWEAADDYLLSESMIVNYGTEEFDVHALAFHMYYDLNGQYPEADQVPELIQIIRNSGGDL